MKISLRAARVNAKMTQKFVANELGITEKTLSLWEKGVTYPNIIQAKKLGELYKTSLDDIIFCSKCSV